MNFSKEDLSIGILTALERVSESEDIFIIFSTDEVDSKITFIQVKEAMNDEYLDDCNKGE